MKIDDKLTLKEIRQRSGISTAAIARMSGLSESTIKRYEREVNEQSNENVDKIIRICYSIDAETVSKAGNRVKECRESHGMNRADFARECGITPSNLHEIERGEQKVTEKTARKIEDRFGVGKDWILYGFDSDKEYPVSDRLIEWIKSDHELREKLWNRMEHYQENNKSLGDLDSLREQRHRLGLTQKQVAERAEISLQQYQKFESGERDIMNASFRITCRVLEALELDVINYYRTYSEK